MKNAKTFWLKVTTSKTTKSVAKKLYDELIQKDTDALTNEKSNDANKYNILNVLDNVGSIFTGAYLHYKKVWNNVWKKYHRENKIKKTNGLMKLKEKNRTKAMNCLKYTLLIIKAQVVCTKN